MGQISRILRRIVCLPILFYQYVIRPVMRPCCRFYPSCSDFALMAIQHHGLFSGVKLTCGRILRCHPWSEGGYDPVLPNKEKS